MNWADLQLLLAFADAGTLKAAAETQGVNISTVSRRLRTLEGEIGAKVVENVGGRLTLTESGERAVAAARAMRHASDDLLRDVAGKDDELAGPVRIGLLEMFVRYHASAFVELSRSYPNLELKFLTSGRLQSLTQREIDVAIRVTQTPEETLVGRSVYAMEFQVFASPELTRSTKDYRKLPWVIWHEAARATLAEQWVAENLPTGCICGRVVSAVSMMDLVQAGVGAAILPRKHALLAGLEPLSPVLEEFTTPVWVLTHRDLASSARVRAVTDHLYRVLRDFGREDGA